MQSFKNQFLKLFYTESEVTKLIVSLIRLSFQFDTVVFGGQLIFTNDG